jgi:hypothetical protein
MEDVGMDPGKKESQRILGPDPRSYAAAPRATHPLDTGRQDPNGPVERA